MPQETSQWLFEIRLEGEEAKAALEGLIESFKRIEGAVVGLGQKFDTAMKQMIQPINDLTSAVDRLDASIGKLRPLDLDRDALQAQQLKTELLEVNRILESRAAPSLGTGRYRLPAGFPGARGGQVVGRAEMVEHIVAGRVGTPVLPHRLEQLASIVERSGAISQRMWEEMVIAGERVAEQLRLQATELTRRTGALVAARLREERPRIIGQLYARAGWGMQPSMYEPGGRGRLPKPEPMVGDPEKELEQSRILEAAIGRKIVLQKLMARGAQDVAEKFEGQFRVTRSKEEILREIARTGTMTTEMEKELGLQTERAGRSARRAGGMFRYFGRYLLRYLLLWQMIQAVRGVMRSWFAAHTEMADAIADFGWRVSATTEDLERYRGKLRDISTLVGMPVAQIASPLAGRMTEADLLRAAEAAKVFGGSVEDWARKLDAGTASLDAYAHGLRISTLATEDYARLIDNASEVAKEFNMTEEETIGLLSALPSVLQTDAEGAAELTEALAGLYEQNQLLMTLGMAPAITVGPGGAPQRRPMGEIMAEIGRQPIAQQRQLAVAIGLTREEQQQFFLDAVAGWAEVQQAIRGTVNATGDMEAALAGADESMKAHMASMKAAWASLMTAIGDTEAAKSGVEGLGNVFKGLTSVIEGTSASVGRLLAETVSLGEALAIVAGLIVSPALAFPMLMAGIGRVSEAQKRAGLGGGAAERGRGYTGVTPGTEGAAGAGAWQGFQVMRLPAGMDLARLQQEVNRLTEEFAQPIQDSMGNWVQLTEAEINSNTQLILVLDELGEKVGTLTAYTPALQQAQENLRAELEQQRFNLERLRDITPAQFDAAMRTTLPMWEARLAGIEGFEEPTELFTFFVGQEDILRQSHATQTAMRYTLQDILEVEEKQLEGMWNIPAGVTMRVPLTSLDLMRWMQGGMGGGAATDMLIEPGGALEAAADAQDAATQAMYASATAQTGAAASMSALAQSVGAAIYGGEPVEPGVAREEALATGGDTRQVIHRPPRPRTGGGGALTRQIPTVPAPGGIGAQMTPFVIRLVLESILKLDGDVLARQVEEREVSELARVSRGRIGGLQP